MKTQYLDLSSANFLNKVGSGKQSGPKFSRRWGGVSYINARKKRVPERRSGLRPSEKELPEQSSGEFCHKNTAGSKSKVRETRRKLHKKKLYNLYWVS
jgi:hypothetical protein